MRLPLPFDGEDYPADMEEGTKDDIELAAAGVADAVFGLLPGGSLLSAAFTVPLQVAHQRRSRQQLEQIQQEIDALRQSGASVPSPEELAASEAFMARLTTTLRAGLETDSDEKRQLLRNALMNGILGHWGTLGADFSRLMARYEPEHVAVLDSLLKLGGGQVGHWIEDAVLKVGEYLGPEPGQSIPASRLGRVMNELVSDDLLQRERISTWPGDYDETNPQPHIEPLLVAVTLLGAEFLRFVAQPPAGPHGEDVAKGE
jgi:hypothetical protein